MKHVKILGTGCSGCKTTLRLIRQVADERGVAVQLEKVESLPE
ncbi:TPA: thioredoxin family protein, partial [Klebsiella pneumoniae]|nr:thioredoxin family protein [Klebsiella pneumoniae]HBX0915410.1 thioredoxin family protein [Klebsiella pneumoniae]